MFLFHQFFSSIQVQVGYHLKGDLDTGRLSGLFLRLWVRYGYHSRTIRGHGSGSSMIFRCDAGLGSIVMVKKKLIWHLLLWKVLPQIEECWFIHVLSCWCTWKNHMSWVQGCTMRFFSVPVLHVNEWNVKHLQDEWILIQIFHRLVQAHRAQFRIVDTDSEHTRSTKFHDWNHCALW